MIAPGAEGRWALIGRLRELDRGHSWECVGRLDSGRFWYECADCGTAAYGPLAGPETAAEMRECRVVLASQVMES